MDFFKIISSKVKLPLSSQETESYVEGKEIDGKLFVRGRKIDCEYLQISQDEAVEALDKWIIEEYG